MSFYICNGSGASANTPSAAVMRTFLDELDPEDEEHGAAWLADDDGNTLEYEVGGNLCFSRGENSRHLSRVPKDRVLALWKQLALGDLDGLEELPWQPGARPPMSPEERAARACANAEAQLYLDRQFYDSLGDERATVPCRSTGCARGSVSLSIFCRPHHFRSVMGRESPFGH